MKCASMLTLPEAPSETACYYKAAYNDQNCHTLSHAIHMTRALQVGQSGV